MRKFLAIIPAVVIVLFINSCNIINPSEAVPTYVHIDSFTFQGNPAYGSSSHKITNVYVFFNGSTVGVFDLPVTFPVIADAPGTLTVAAGVDVNGISGNEQIYPFYESDTLTLNPSPGNTINFSPKTSYLPQVSVPFAYYEPFETAGSPFNRVSGDADLTLTNNSSEVFEGNGAGKIRLDAGKDSTTVINVNPIYLQPGAEAYIELDYMGTLSMAVGMSSLLKSTGNLYTEYLIGLKPRTSWGKIYISIKDFVTARQGSEYHLLIHTTKQPGLTDGYLLLDNIKVVTFK